MTTKSVTMAQTVPELEDVPEILHKIKAAENIKKTQIKNQTTAGNKKLQPMEKESTGFGGFKKGFLFGSPSNAKKTTVEKADNMPLIKACPQKSSLVIKEVQDAMVNEVKEAMDANNAMQFQDQLAQRLEKNPKVADVIADPAWIPILDELQRDPEATMKKYQHDKKIIATLKELCGVLGDTFLHLSSKGNSEDAQSYAESPQVTEALTDPYIKQMMSYMKQGDNAQVHRCVQSANESQKKKIKTLIDVNMFRFST